MIELNTIYNEDCLIGMQRIPDKSIDMILCDLPYGTTACKWDVVIPFEPLWKQYERIIKDNGAIVLTASQPFTSALVMSNPVMFKYEWIWEKQLGSGFLDANKKPLKKHENVLIFYKRQPTYNPIKEVAKKLRSIKKNSGKGNAVYGKYKSMSWQDDGTRYPSSIIEVTHDKSRFITNKEIQNRHNTQKPVALFEYLIKTYTNEGETVLDNCMGSGTTAIACIKLNRNYIGFETDEKYFKIMQKRIKEQTMQTKMF